MMGVCSVSQGWVSLSVAGTVRRRDHVGVGVRVKPVCMSCLLFKSFAVINNMIISFFSLC